MIKCKHCNGTKFGVEVVNTKTVSAIAINGEIVKMLDDTESNQEKIVYKFCPGCNKPITEDDLITTEKCTICGKEDDLVDGKCKDCQELSNQLSKMSQDELLKMILESKSNNSNNNEVKKSKDSKKNDDKVEETPKVNNEEFPPKEIENIVKEENIKQEKEDSSIKEENVETEKEVLEEIDLVNNDKVADDLLDNCNIELDVETSESLDDIINAVNNITVDTEIFLKEENNIVL